MTDEETSSETLRDWAAVRAWANLFIAGATLLVAIVSIWLTTQISGLEDYLRSEIALRNNELRSTAAKAEALEDQIKASAARLEELRATADQLTIASNEAQIRISDAQSQAISLLTEKQRTVRELSNARERLSDVMRQTEEQKLILERFRKDEVLMSAVFQLGSSTSFITDSPEKDDQVTGNSMLKEIRNFGLEVKDPTKSRYYQDIRRIAPEVCRHLQSFKPTFPLPSSIPKLEPIKGEPVGNGNTRTTQKEIDAYEKRREAWFTNRNDIFEYNWSIGEARRAAENYLRDSAWHCSCVALNGIAACDAKPESPDFDAIILPAPASTR